MRVHRILFTSVLMLAFALMALPLWAHVIHVPADYNTIQSGISAALIGDTILVAQGTYSEHLNYLGKDILIKSESGPELTIIQRVNTGVPLIKFQNGESPAATLDGFTVMSSLNAPGVSISNSSATLKNNIFQQNVNNADGGAVAALYGNVLNVMNNIFQNNTSLGGTGGAIRCYGIKLVAVGNQFISNIAVTDAGAIHLRANANSEVHHNLFYRNHCSRVAGTIVFSECQGGDFYNNTVVANSTDDNRYGAGVDLWMSSNIHAYNNIIANNSGKGFYSYSSNNCSVTYNDVWNNRVDYDGVIPGVGSLSIDPLLEGGDPFSFQLTENSPCIDTGDPASPNDPDGSRADMGAYYFSHSIQGLTFKISDVFGSQGNVVDVPLLAEGFNGHPIGGLEFHIAFDPGCLEYDSIMSDYLSGADINVVNGDIHMIWEDISNPPELPDSTALLVMRFVVNGPLDSTCAINWLPNNQVVNPSGEPYADIDYNSGGVTIAVLHEIGGRIVYFDGFNPISGAAVALTGSMLKNDESAGNGLFAFDNLISGNYAICTSMARNDSGVTVADIIKIRREIVALEPFESPYQYLAADVNNSGSVTVADAVKIRRYLADLEDLPGGNWTFVDSSFAINDSNWTEAPHCIEVSLMDQDILDLAFYGIRRGDVNGSWPGLGLSLGAYNDTVSLQGSTISGLPGDTISMPITGRGITQIAGLEMHLNYPSEGLTFIGISSDVVQNATINGGNGRIHLVWDDIFNPITINDGDEVLSINFQIQENAPQVMIVSFTGASVADEIGNELHVMTGNGQVTLNPTGINGNSTIPTVFNLAQNYPNPFNAETKISFALPKASNVTLDIIDMMGRRITILENGHFDAGNYDITWNGRSDDGRLVSSGVYFYRLKTDSYQNTKRMLMLK